MCRAVDAIFFAISSLPLPIAPFRIRRLWVLVRRTAEMTNPNVKTLWASLRRHKNSIYIKLAVMVSVCFGLCVVCYFVEKRDIFVRSKRPNGSQYRSASGLQHDRGHPLHPPYEEQRADPREHLTLQHGTEKLIQIERSKEIAESEARPPLSNQLFSRIHPAYAGDEEGSGQYAETNVIELGDNIAIAPTDPTSIFGADSATGNMIGTMSPRHTAQEDFFNGGFDFSTQLYQPGNALEVEDFNKKVLLKLKEVPENGRIYLSSWSSEEQEYFSHEDALDMDPGMDSAEVISDEFIISDSDKGNYVQVTDIAVHDEAIKEIPSLLEQIFGKMSGLIGPLKQPPPDQFRPMYPRPVSASHLTNFKDTPMRSDQLQLASYAKPVWNSNLHVNREPHQLPLHHGTWLSHLNQMNRQLNPKYTMANKMTDSLNLWDTFFKSKTYDL